MSLLTGLVGSRSTAEHCPDSLDSSSVPCVGPGRPKGGRAVDCQGLHNCEGEECACPWDPEIFQLHRERVEMG